jgi:hypothetical protein
MNKDAKIYRIDYLDNNDHLHHKYYTCLSTNIALEQFNAGCEHKHICPTRVRVYKCEQGCHSWELVHTL